MSRDPRTESLLKRGGYKFVYHDKELFSNIDLKASEENPARLNRKIDPLTVTQYGCNMLDGAVFPAIVLLRQDGAGHLVATGMHRIKGAIEAGRDYFDAYVVTEADQYQFELLIRLLNSIEGRGDTQKDQLRHIVWLHEQYGRHSLNELADKFHITESTVHNFWNENLGTSRGTRLGFDFSRLPQKTILELQKIPSDLVFTKAAEFVMHYDISGRDTEELVKELKAVRNQGEGAEILVVKKYQDIQDELRRRTKARGKRSTGAECTRFIGQVRAINRKVARGIDPLKLPALPDIDDSITVVEDGVENLQKILAELQRIKRLHEAGGSSGSGYAQAAAASI